MKWISVKDELPEDNSRVLIDDEGLVEIAEYKADGWPQGFIIIENGGEYVTEIEPTHWMPLPKIHNHE